MQLAIDRMTLADLDEVARIERLSFAAPWPLAAYRRELRRAEQNAYIVLRRLPGSEPGDERHGLAVVRGLLPRGASRRREEIAPNGRIAGFAGMWQLYDESHVTTIAVDPEFRGRGLGELLFLSLLTEAMGRGSLWLTLEVRVSNRGAQQLYHKYGLTVSSRRPAYYTNDGEDAFVMWSPSLRDPDYRERLRELRDDLAHRLEGVAEAPRVGDVLLEPQLAGAERGELYP